MLVYAILNSTTNRNFARITMNFEFLPLEQSDISIFKHDIQEAFQKGYEDVYGEIEGIILPEKDIDSSLNTAGSVAYKAVVNGEIVGGTVVTIDEKTQHSHLDLLYVKYGTQTKGIGFAIWKAIEKPIPIQRFGKPVLRILKREISISMLINVNLR